jgi:hypothetical protein
MSDTSTPNVPHFAVILSVLGGSLILLNSVLLTIWFLIGGSVWGMMGSFTGMMDGFQGMMGSVGFPLAMVSSFALIGIVTGGLVLIGAIMLYRAPRDHVAWGIVILVFSVISLISMGGFLIGALVGVVGGLLALVRE